MNLSQLAETPGQLGAFAAMVWAWGLAFLPRLGAAALMLVIGLLVAGWAARVVGGVLRRTPHIDETVIPVIAIVVRYGIMILVIVATLGQLGVQTASLLAVLGAAGLAIGLALQGTLSNIAAGIMLLYLRPFRVGDYIETDTASGTVRTVGLFVTELDTFDGLFVFAPNSVLWNKALINLTRNARRLMSIPIGITYDSDAASAREILLAMAQEDVRILKDPAPVVYVEKYSDKGIEMTFRAWAPNALFADAQRAMTEEAKRRLEGAGIEIAFPAKLVQALSAASVVPKGGASASADE